MLKKAKGGHIVLRLVSIVHNIQRKRTIHFCEPKRKLMDANLAPELRILDLTDLVKDGIVTQVTNG